MNGNTFFGVSMRRLLATLALMFLATPVFAQTTAPPTAVVVNIYRQGQPTVAATVTIPVASFSRNQTVVNPPAGVVPNPNEIRIADWATAGRDAVWRDAGGGILTALAADATTIYEAGTRFVTAAGTTAESPRSNLFSRPGELPAAPAQTRVVSGS